MIYLPPLFLAFIGFLVLVRFRQAVLVFMGVEIMMAAANWVTLATVDYFHPGARSAVLLLFGIAVAAAEATVGLAIVLRLAQRHRTTEVSAFDTLQDRGL